MRVHRPEQLLARELGAALIAREHRLAQTRPHARRPLELTDHSKPSDRRGPPPVTSVGRLAATIASAVCASMGSWSH
jgi:hypothetical protein